MDSTKTILTFLITTALIISGFYFDFGFSIYVVFILTMVVCLASYIDTGEKWILSLGFQKKNFNAKNLLVLAPITALIILLIYRFFLLPVVTKITGVPIDISAFDTIRGNPNTLFVTLLFVWTSAAFGEEILFRGYLMTRFKRVFGTSTFSIVANILLFAVFFGAIHSYQGITGQILVGITGAIIATIFHFKKHDLWFCVILHGMIDTFAFVAVYFNIF